MCVCIYKWLWNITFIFIVLIMTIEQHTETIHKATTWARELTSANLDEWNPQGEKNGVKIYTQEDGKLIRGDYLFKTSLFTYEEYAAVTSSTIIRNMCKLRKKGVKWGEDVRNHISYSYVLLYRGCIL